MDQALCADRLDLVDAAYARPGGKEADTLKKLCRNCLLNLSCLTTAMTSHQDGIWGGTTPNVRTRHGAPKADGTRRRAS